MSSRPALHRSDAGNFLPEALLASPGRLRQTAWERWERWDMALLAEKPVPSAGGLDALAQVQDAAGPTPLINEAQVAELTELRLQARKAGEAEGREQGREQGYAQGLHDGHAAGLAAAQAQAAQLQTLAAALPAALQLAQNSVADDLLALAFDIARQVLGQALATEPQAILAVVHTLLQAEPSLSGAPQLLLHPDDAALVKELLADDLKAAGWRIRTDAQIARGGCRVTAHSGERDATVQARWERVSAALARPPAPGNLTALEGTEPA